MMRMLNILPVLAAATFFLAPPARAQEGISWLDNYQEALKEAKKTGKPIFLEFRCEA
jgi:hypothetical protein